MITLGVLESHSPEEDEVDGGENELVLDDHQFGNEFVFAELV
jgi:hypothetical protein